MAAPANSGESDMATEDFCSTLSPLLSPRWSQLCLTPSPPRPFLPSSNSNYSMVMQYQGSNQSMDDPPQNQEHHDIVEQAPYSALLHQQQQLRKNWSEASDWRPRGGGIMTMNNQGFEESNMGFEESMEMTTCFYFPPSPTNFPLYRPMPSVFVVFSELKNISSTLSCKRILEDKNGALHVLKEKEGRNIFRLVFKGVGDYWNNKFSSSYQIARAAGMSTEDFKSLWKNMEDVDYDEREVTIRRINWLEQHDEDEKKQHDEDTVDQPFLKIVSVAQQLIQNRDGELDVIVGGGVFTVNGLERKDGEGPPTTPETLLICQAKRSIKVWLGHGGQWAIEFRSKCNHLNIGSFTTVEDAISAYELVARWSGWMDLTGFPGLFENENRSKLPLQLPLIFQELNPVPLQLPLIFQELNPVEAVGIGSEGKGDCIMADQARLNSGCLGKRKIKEKNPGGERRSKKTNGVGIGSGGTGQSEMEEGQPNSRYLGNEKRKEMTLRGERRNKETGGVRIAISLEQILQAKEMPLKNAAKYLKVSKSTLKRACREYDIPRWPPRGEYKLIGQSCPNESPVVVDKEPIPQLNFDTLPSSNQVSATIGTKIVIVKARFGSAMMKFQLSWPWGMEELNEQVKKRLGEEAENYHINYKDEDDEYIMIGCDEDLQDHISRSNLLGTNWIEVFLHPK